MKPSKPEPFKIKQTMQRVFEKIGGEQGLEQTLNLFYQKMSGDVLIGFFFTGKDLHHIAGQQKKFLMRAWGLSNSYDGKPPTTAHLGLAPILQGHFDRRLVILEETLKERGLAAEEIKAWVQFERSFQKMLVS